MGKEPWSQGTPGQTPTHSMAFASLPVQQEQGEHRWEVGGRRVGRQVKHEQDDDAAGGGDQVIELQRQREPVRTGHEARRWGWEGTMRGHTMSHT